MAVKYSPAWYRNQKRLRDLGYNVDVSQAQPGSSLHSSLTSSIRSQQGAPRPSSAVLEEPTPVSTLSQQEATGSSSAIREEPTAVPGKIEDFQTMLNELTSLNTGTASSSTTPTPTETSPAPAPTPTEDTRQELIDENLQKKYGGGMSAAELQDFETLIGRLEGSKMRQAGQLNRARQRERYGGGLASMMRNF